MNSTTERIIDEVQDLDGSTEVITSTVDTSTGETKVENRVRHVRDIQPMNRAERRKSKIRVGYTIAKYPEPQDNGDLIVRTIVAGDYSYLSNPEIHAKLMAAEKIVKRPRSPVLMPYLLTCLFMNAGLIGYDEPSDQLVLTEGEMFNV